MHNANFENAHKYNLLSGKDKPLQASKFVNKVIRGEIINPDCKKWLDDIMRSKSIIHDMDYINRVKKSKEDIKKEESSYCSLDEEE